MKCLLRNATIVDSSGKRVTVHILTDDKKILKVSKEALNIPAMEYDLSGYTLMPGFINTFFKFFIINTHVHLMDCFDGFNNEKLKKWLISGITYLRDEGIFSRHNATDAFLWRENNRKSCMYPSIAICGKFISAVNGQGGVAPLGVTTETEARDAVSVQVNAGVDHIKISLDEGYDSYTQSLDLLPLNILEVICDQAHKLGKKVSAHVNRSDKLEILLKAGKSRIILPFFPLKRSCMIRGMILPRRTRSVSWLGISR